MPRAPKVPTPMTATRKAVPAKKQSAVGKPMSATGKPGNAKPKSLVFDKSKPMPKKQNLPIDTTKPKAPVKPLGSSKMLPPSGKASAPSKGRARDVANMVQPKKFKSSKKK